ncbi:Methyltransferase TYW3 [Teratosphaeria destructans]|uniref:tRNA(Phe) 7-[(3-amino-3-carboxypropyl)-4-demethylwyosine(37)-N(4)]-methyltransferase n=1 Tax=Teratosphaeria destructans TaxID=418781 RepID=A0A9W7T1Y6_9PEZI|nr:Methyltransferase TYW3 [Teratosphaeria destructans]
MPASFAERKAKILADLSIPDAQYQDLSPKGSVDEGIRELIGDINALPDCVTTSSCAGRVAAYLEGFKTAKGGGKWLFTSHDPVTLPQYPEKGSLYQSLGLSYTSGPSVPSSGDEGARFVHLKFEPLILHILTANLQAAQHAAAAALEAGFRESGVNGILDSSKGHLHQPATPMVAVRSSGLAFDCIIGYTVSSSENPEIKPMVTEDYLRTLVDVANQRFTVNRERTERFRKALLRQT